MEMSNLKELFLAELSDMHSAERQLIEALPKLARQAGSPQLKRALEQHLRVTEGQLERLDRIFDSLGEKPKRKKCKGMEGLIGEGSEMVREATDEAVRDAAIIAGAQKVEHYEIAAYGTLRTYAETLGDSANGKLLDQSLEEEKEADVKLSEIAESAVNVEAASPA
jgi:ferritin-like metal-binding protein YciE